MKVKTGGAREPKGGPQLEQARLTSAARGSTEPITSTADTTRPVAGTGAAPMATAENTQC